jgi:lipoic acid synthetase
MEHGDPFRIVGQAGAPRGPRPDWLKVRLPSSEGYFRLRRLVAETRLNTVCEDARCPNIGECWGAGTATFMILGDVCTRACGFCAVTTGRPAGLDLDEPRRVAEAIARLGLGYAVITSVDRDDLEDGGASIFAETVRQLRARCPETRIELLVPDFQGSRDALAAVVRAGPDVLAHNVETVPRLYRVARAGSRYRRSLVLLGEAKRLGAAATKSSLMLGLGERREEVLEVLEDLREHDVDSVTLGQYLQPTRDHLPVARYWTPQEFDELRSAAENLGFRSVAAGPLVRSSYHAEQQAASLQC